MAGAFAKVERSEFAKSQQIHTNSLFMAFQATVLVRHVSVDGPYTSEIPKRFPLLASACA